MAKRKQSNEEVIESGQQQLARIQQSIYLHNYDENYRLIGKSSFDPVDIRLMDGIWDKLIKRQEKEEQKIYQMLGISNVGELNEAYLEAGGGTEFLATTAADLISQATKNALVDLNGRTNKSKKSEFTKAVQNTLEDMVEKNFQNDKELENALKQGLGEKVAKILLNLQKSKKTPRNMNDYIKRAEKAISAQFRGEILETETGVVMARVIDQLIGKRGSVHFTGTVKNSRGKQIKADHTVKINDSFSFGISEKNYLPDGEGNVEVSLHSSGSLENFYKLVNEMKITSRGGADLKGILEVIKHFREPEFKYHLVNQAAHTASKNIKDTDVGENIIGFVKKCLPLFIGAQFKIAGDKTNVDFFNINGKLVPVSTILKDIWNGGGYASPRIGLYSNYQVPWYEMLRAKTDNSVEDNQYYSTATIKTGSFYGQNLYKQINTGTIHLKLALAKL